MFQIKILPSIQIFYPIIVVYQAHLCIICQIQHKVTNLITIIRILLISMPPKKKIDIKTAKAAKAKANAKAVTPAKSASKAKPVSKSKSVDTKKQPAQTKDKSKKAKPEPAPIVAAVVVPSQPRGKRGKRGSSPVASPPAKKVKGAKSPEPKSNTKVDNSLAKSKSKDQKIDKVVEPPKVDTKADEADKSKAKDLKTKSKDSQQLVKVVTKGGAAVDSLVPNKQNYRVFQEGGKIYAATLNQANLDHNNNKFYIVQVLLNEKTGAIHVWNRWGRVGVPGQNCLKGPFPKDAAIRDYNNKINQKTVKGDYKEIQIKYDDDEEDNKPKQDKKPKKQNNVASKMDPAMQKLISLIFDVTIMNNTMKEIGYDAKKMPLGKLGEGTIKQAYTVLNNLTEAIKKGQKSQYSKLSSQFYTLIPHDFGFQKMHNFVLDNQEKVKEKLRMLQAISDMKITTKLLNQGGDEDTSVHDQNYKKLGCNIHSLDHKSKQYKLLSQYFQNTKGCFSQVTVGDIYEVERPNENSVYNTKLGNNMLLWHGSRIANFVGILSQGLRIAPPQAPVSGYLFGKGIYLADLAEKSIHYCRSFGSPKALILLIQGAIGQPNILLNSSYQAKQLMEKNGKHSTKCYGSKAPPQSCYVNLNNMIVPNGKAVPTNSGSYMGHNEYIVYNINQARIRYIIEMNMNGG